MLIFFNIFFQLQTIENVEELRAVFASSDGMDVLSHIGLRSIPSKADMTCKQVTLRYLTVFYQHCYWQCKVKSFSFMGWFVFVSMYFFLGCFVYYIYVLFVCFNREFIFSQRLCIIRPSFFASRILMNSFLYSWNLLHLNLWSEKSYWGCYSLDQAK